MTAAQETPTHEETHSLQQPLPLILRHAPLLILPRFLTGFTLPNWWRYLRKHRFAVDWPFWPRALFATAGAAFTSVFRIFEQANTPPLDEEIWRKPVFILGLPRSGTTHLFNLLAREPSLCWPTRFDSFNPHTLLTLRRLGVHRLFALGPGQRRAMDRVIVNWMTPEEDAYAVSLLAGDGWRLRLFPREPQETSQEMMMIGIPRQTFQQALRIFSQKLVALHGKPILLKSPAYTGCIKELLEVFPEARFVTLFRHPERQAASFLAMHESGNPFWATLQWPNRSPPEKLLSYIKWSLNNYFETRGLIPAERLLEVRYENLVAAPLETLANIRSFLGIEPAIPEAQPSRIERHEASPAQNRSLPPEFDQLLRDVYAPLYERGIYSPPARD
jgi:hypothetical protein